MDIERTDGARERRTYVSMEEMMKDAEKEAKNPATKKLTLHFPRLRIPGRHVRRRKEKP